LLHWKENSAGRGRISGGIGWWEKEWAWQDGDKAGALS
jgi:hypothetical protein